MSKWDRVNVAVLSSCCVRAIHGRNERAADGDAMACAGCGTRIVFRNGAWTRAENQQ